MASTCGGSKSITTATLNMQQIQAKNRNQADISAAGALRRLHQGLALRLNPEVRREFSNTVRVDISAVLNTLIP
jgi:hypothetical protein